MTTDVSTLGSLVRASEALTPGHAELFTATHLPHLEAVVDQFIKRSGRGDLTAADSVPLALQVLANASRYGAPLLNLYIQSRPEAAAFTALAVQTLRLIANLVADHEPNRNLILQLGIPHHLVALVKDHAIPIDVLRAALGAMLNASLDYEPCQKSLIEQTAIEALVGTFQNPARIVDHDMVVNLVIRNLSNLAEQEASLSHFHSTTAATTIIGLAAVYKPVFQGPMGQEVFMDLLSLLEALLRHPPIQVDVVRNGKLVTLLDLVEVLVLGQLQVPASEATDASAPIARALESLSLDSDDEEEAGEEKTSPSPAGATDSSPKTQAIDLLSQTLVSVTSNDIWVLDFSISSALPYIVLFGQYLVFNIQFELLHMHRCPRPFLSDDNMDRLLEDPAVFSRLRTWLWLRPSSVETEPDLTSKKDPKKLAARTGQLQTLAALCIGNVARSDKICLAVVQEHRIGPALVDLLKETKDYRIQHAVTGLLRNLTIPEPNKRVFGQTPLIPLVARLVDTKIAPLQMNVIRILKHLVSYNQSPNTLQMVQPLGIDSAPAMVHSVAQAAAAVTRAMEDEQDEIDLFRNTPLGLLIGVLGDNYPEPIYCEGGRVVADVVKTAFTAQDDAATQTRLILSNQLAQLIPPLAFLLTQAKFQVLQHEAIFALSLLMHHADTTSCMRALERCLAPVSSGPQASTSDGPVGQAPPQPMATVDWLAKLIDLAGDGQKAAESRSNALKLLLSLSTDLLSHSEGLVLMKAGLLTINQTNIPCPEENLYLLAPEQEVFRYTSELHTELAKLRDQ
ncbi:armadillo-type protein [Dimargaris cristalligena]|uniref:Armadillo-type protein n=1 Tax=Dimargaris cristalligena TaxID=215637 RepID=A0A4P9ZUL9_9FUNG|nr:armadillo-type protein [Dimargaris cristalligena]|eukprot:RKP37264.1 armadillo-type protein [Dimargaris cristalligena]